MKVATIKKPGGLDKIEIEERPDPLPGRGELLVKVRALSLNFHDFAVASGLLGEFDDRILISDAAGEVIAVGEGVQGFAAELVAMPVSAFTPIPEGWTMEEAATLPCAALTAWRGVMTRAAIKPGDWVLTQGTGGVSIFALQFAKAAGARVISTSSSAEKLERLKALGADHVINYRETPNWGAKAKELAGGRGVDEVVEIGGAGTLGQSIAACRVGGHISLIGVLAGFAGEVPTAELFAQNIRVDGITVGSREQQLDMIRAINANDLKPVISDIFRLDNLKDAFEHLSAQKHFGKIVVTV